ncbi:MAG: TldD/PmbA family protein [Ignavibacteriae bacterium]|nr:MAG: TldD/PmbA family protein [Ignavibacteriota bacterium]
MDRRKFLITSSLALPGALITKSLGRNILESTKGPNYKMFDDDYIKKIADNAISLAKQGGASYSDFRLTNFKSQRLFTRENIIQGIADNEDYGFAVRVLVDGVWGFAASSTFNESEAARVTAVALDIAKANKKIQKRRVELVPVPAYTDTWKTPIKKDPFSVSIDDKVNFLFKVNDRAKELGANFCSSFLWAVNEWKYFASSEGSYIKQDLHRINSGFDVTVIDKSTGKFESRSGLQAPIGKGYEYIEEYDWFGDMEKAVEEAKMKHKAKSVEEGKKDIILDPTHLWLTIHESCGHPTELDRALGFEANYAGTSFMTTDKLGKLKYGSEHINIFSDRTQKDCLATRGYDDDGVKTTEWDVIKEGVFVGYQTTREMANYIGAKESNACAYADNWGHFPIQRMPNTSLRPGKKKLSLQDLISDTEDGIYIIGDGSWSIDMQRYNFQFTGQAFYEIKNGKITQMLRDVAYQGNTVDFWNSCDAVCDESEYKLGGSFFCGKGEPGQVSPVSHGSSPARFRKVNILNTGKEASK